MSILERLQKFLSAAGIASRRRSEELIRQGRVKVNGQRAVLGTKVNPESDLVSVDDKIVKKQKKIYVALFKPSGVVTTCSDPQGRRTVIDLVPDLAKSVFPVGRLDFDSEGILLLTNDGNLAYHLTHPRYEVKKTYQVLISGKLKPVDLESLEQGILLDDGWTAPAEVNLLKQSKGTATIEIKIHEGRNRQIRRMFMKLGYSVLALKRTHFGFLEIGQLKPAEYRFLDQSEVKKLWRLIKSK